MAETYIINKNLQFAGNVVSFSAISDFTASAYLFDFGNGEQLFTTSATPNYIYQNYGTFYPSATIYEEGGSAHGPLAISAGVQINLRPDIKFEDQDPFENENLTIEDDSGDYYFADTIDHIELDFGDGTSISSNSPSSAFSHSYSASGIYEIGLSAYDVSANVSSDSYKVRIFGSDSAETTELDFVTTCGPSESRFGSNRRINLTSFLPEQKQQEEIYDFVKFFEDFLNEMYAGLHGFETTETQIGQNESKLAFSYDNQNLSASPKISILEKIHRLSELHDPDLIDIDYIQFFAEHMGYRIDIDRNEIGFGFLNSSAPCSASDNQKYLRFMVRNLPNWYKIKTTNDMIKIMLYSFGLVADIYNHYTKDYGEDSKNWKVDYDGDMRAIPDSWYPTPHFTAIVDIDASLNNIFFKLQEGEKVVRAIESIKPLNGVFRGLTSKTTQLLQLYCGANARLARYIRIPCDGFADSWAI